MSTLQQTNSFFSLSASTRAGRVLGSTMKPSEVNSVNQTLPSGPAVIPGDYLAARQSWRGEREFSERAVRGDPADPAVASIRSTSMTRPTRRTCKPARRPASARDINNSVNEANFTLRSQ